MAAAPDLTNLLTGVAGVRSTPEKISGGGEPAALPSEGIVIRLVWQGKAVVPAV